MSSDRSPNSPNLRTSDAPTALDVDFGVHDTHAHPAHRHLDVMQPRGQDRVRRFAVIALSLAAVALFVLAFRQPFWSFKLYAPQYPHGLTLVISLTGLSGDVHEIDMLNHYIGMAHLSDAAALERRYAAYGITMIATTVLALTLLAGRKLGNLILVVGALFPLGFLADSFYWLRRFGHELDPRAPLHIPAFTPQLFGNGEIGQFMTFAAPQVGFWSALAGVAVLVGVVLVRGRVCARCERAGTCGAVCKPGFVFPESGANRSARAAR